MSDKLTLIRGQIIGGFNLVENALIQTMVSLYFTENGKEIGKTILARTGTQKRFYKDFLKTHYHPVSQSYSNMISPAEFKKDFDFMLRLRNSAAHEAIVTNLDQEDKEIASYFVSSKLPISDVQYRRFKDCLHKILGSLRYFDLNS